MINITVFLFLFFAAKPAAAQHVDGHWFGIGMLQVSGEYNSYLSELVLRQKGRNVWGTWQYYFKDSLVKVAIAGSFDASSRKLSIKPFPLMYYGSPSAKNSIDVNMSGDFVLVASKAESVLSGMLTGEAKFRYTVPDVHFRLKKSDDTAALVMMDGPVVLADTIGSSLFPPPVMPPPEVQAATDFAKREKVFTKELEITGSTLRIELYDNGQVDYDSVSLFFNNKRILAKTKLDHRAIRLTIEFDPSLEYNELSMFAENLGMIPPNTAALVVYDGSKRYETLLSSDLGKSATLRLTRKK